MKTKMEKWLDALDGAFLKMDGFDDCIVGICQKFGQEDVLIYDREKVVKRLQSKGYGMTPEEAEEFFEYNQTGAYVGPKTPAFLIKKY